MNTFVVLVAVIAVVSAATENVTPKSFAYNSGYYPANQAYYPGQQGYYPGYQGYSEFRGYYPGQQGYYPGYQGYQGYQGFQGYYPGYQGQYQGFQDYNRGYYQTAPVAPVAPVKIAAPVAPVYPAVPNYTPAPYAQVKVNPVPTVVKSPVYSYKTTEGKLPAIVRQSQEVNFDGNFKYGYETENGIVAQASGYVKNAGSKDAAQVIEGSYAYVGDDGAPVEVKYYADETGYHAVGNVIPTTPPEIARSLELIASQPQAPEDSQK